MVNWQPVYLTLKYLLGTFDKHLADIGTEIDLQKFAERISYSGWPGTGYKWMLTAIFQS